MNKKHITFVSGNFNVVHPGHLRLLRFAKECGDWLVVGVVGDALAGPAAHVPENLRLEGVQSHSLVDEAFILNEPVTEAISRIKPDVVVKGKEHEFAQNPEQDALDHYGGRLLFSSGETLFSSLDLIRNEVKEIDLQSILMPEEYLKRHDIDKDRLKQLLDDYSRLKVCVIGDLIVDEYITCEALGMSREDPAIVVTPLDTTRFIGGAGIVAAHAAGLGASVQFISVTGNDPSREFAETRLSESGVEAHLLTDENRPTTLKQRFRSKGKSLLRVSHLHQGGISSVLQARFLERFEQVMENLDILVFSDFNYGCLPQAMVEKIVAMAKERKIFMAADSQSSSQFGDISRFRGMDLITPTEHEARISTHNREDGLVVLAEQLRQQADAKNILLKLGEEGLLIHAGDRKNGGWLTDRVAALNRAPKDVAGAGDSLLITSAMTMAAGGTIWDAACWGSLAAAVQVGRVGNTPLRSEELSREIV